MRDAVGRDEHVSIWLRIYELCTHTAKVSCTWIGISQAEYLSIATDTALKEGPLALPSCSPAAGVCTKEGVDTIKAGQCNAHPGVALPRSCVRFVAAAVATGGMAWGTGMAPLGSRSHTVSVSDSDTEDRLYCRM